MNNKRAPYDPGVAKGIKSLGYGCYEVESFREEGFSYRVDLNRNRCTCAHSSFREAADCKHRAAARAEARRLTLATAMSLTYAQLRKHIDRTDLRPEIRDAIETAYWNKLVDSPEADRIPMPAAQSEVVCSRRVTGEDGKIRLVFDEEKVAA